jgi:1-acyl-sn-glycerol-3-phosphate acyltransferase
LSAEILLGYKASVKRFKDFIPDTLIYKMAPFALMEFFHKYFRIEIEGLENLPKRGRAIITPNHSGFSGFDAMLLSHEINKAIHRPARIMTHKLWFMHPFTTGPANKLGFFEANTENGLNFLKKNNLVVLFPEGEIGNFKATSKAYQLQEFKRGFLRMALQTHSPIIPTLIIGAEETHINLSQVEFTKKYLGISLPVPLNIIPLPAKWKIKFLNPIELPYDASYADDVEFVHETAAEIRELMQSALNEEIAKRTSVYF